MLLFDGDCAFCSTAARWLVRHVTSEAAVEPWQRVDLAPLGLTAEQCDAAVQWVDERSSRSGAAGIAALLRTSRPWWRVVGVALGSRIGLVFAEPVYRWVSAHRHRLPGGTSACAPRPPT